MSISEAPAAEADDRRRRLQLYIDEGGTIAMAKGATDRWLGTRADALADGKLAQYLADESQFALSDVLCSVVLQEPLAETLLWLRNAETGTVSGFRVTGGPQTFNEYYRLVFDLDPALDYATGAGGGRAGFAGHVEKAVAAAAGDPDRKPIGMTFVEVGDVRGLSRDHGLDPARVRGFTDKVEERLRREAADGRTVGRVDTGRYGVVHADDADMDAVRSDLEGYLRDVDPDRKTLNVGTSTVALDRQSLADGEVRSAIDHAVESFADSGLDAVIFDTLDDSQADYLDRRRNRRDLLERAIAERKLNCHYRPVCNVRSWTAEQLVAEVQAELADDGLGASEILQITDDDPSLRARVDQETCRGVLEDPSLEGVAVAVDVAIRSMLEAEVLQMLHDFAKRLGRRRLVLRISGLDEVAPERVSALETLRRAGFAVALYGRELGAVTPQRLQALPVDFIVMDPSFVVDPDALKQSLPGLNAMAGRCREHGIQTVFEGVMESDVARLLQRVEGALAAGPYFGRPKETAADVHLPVRGRRKVAVRPADEEPRL